MLNLLKEINEAVIDNIKVISQGPINNVTTTVESKLDPTSLFLGALIGLGIALALIGAYFFIKAFAKEIKEDIIEQAAEKLKKEQNNENDEEEQ